MSEDTIPQFNLVDSPWIKVQKTAGELELVSLEQLFREGYSITKLAHESALEDSAMLAFLEPHSSTLVLLPLRRRRRL